MQVGEREETFPKDPNKTYSLMAIVEGESSQVEKGPEDMVLSWPHLISRELMLFLAVFMVFLGISLFFNAPLEEPANPLHPTNPAKAPWYFVGVQEWVSYSAFWGGVFVPAVIALAMLFLPYLDGNPKGMGVWFSRERRIGTILFSIFVIAVIFFILLGQFSRGPNWEFYWPWQGW